MLSKKNITFCFCLINREIMEKYLANLKDVLIVCYVNKYYFDKEKNHAH